MTERPPTFSLRGKVAVVTGAASGIGAAVVRRFAGAGAETVLIDRDDPSQVADEIGGMPVQADVSQEESVEEAFAAIEKRFERIDVLVNNAGIALDPVSIDETDEKHFRAHIDINVIGVLWGLKHGARIMQDGGAIVNTASVCGVMGFPDYASYNTSKYSVVGLTQVAAVELGRRGIRVNCVCPTSVRTPMLETFEEGAREARVLSAMSTLESIIDPEHVAAAMHFLVADDCPVISGQPLMVDCGLSTGISRTMWEKLGAEDA